MQNTYDRYVDCVTEEILQNASRYYNNTRLSSIFIGGGTPTELKPGQLESILDVCQTRFQLADMVEISVEVNPGTVDSKRLNNLRSAGFNRISIGVQSFIESELRLLDRCHTASEAVHTMRVAKDAGFRNLSIDLMYGLPGQTLRDWQWNLDTALSLKPDHLSLYNLTFEEGTPIFERRQNIDIHETDDETIISMDNYNQEATNRAGIHRYEISNYCLPGFECTHNLNYWQNNEYIGVGASAVSYIAGVREKRVEEPVKYCSLIENSEDIIEESERLSVEQSFRETVMMSMRLSEGVPLEYLKERFGIDLREYYGETLTPLLAADLVEFKASRFRATDKGRLLLNSVLTKLI
jgi:oxygen-independent coproporphyrinogen III oxidase